MRGKIYPLGLNPGTMKSTSQMKRTSENLGIIQRNINFEGYKGQSNSELFCIILRLYPNRTLAHKLLQERGYEFPRDFRIYEGGEDKPKLLFEIIKTLRHFGIELIDGTIFIHKRPYKGESPVKITSVAFGYGIYLCLDKLFSSDGEQYILPSGYGEQLELHEFLEKYEPAK